MLQLPYIFSIASLLLLLGCQRNTNELPTTDIYFTKTAYTSTNDARLTGFFDEHVGSQPYSLSAHFLAQPQLLFTNARVIVETYTGTPNYNTAQYFPPVQLSSLTPTLVAPDNTIISNISLPFDTSMFNIYLLGYANSPFTFSGYYRTGLVTETFTNGSTNLVLAKCLIDAGGNTTIYLSDPGFNTLTGVFTSTTAFAQGSMVTAGATPVNNISGVVASMDSTSLNLSFQLSTSQPIIISGAAISTLTFNFLARE